MRDALRAHAPAVSAFSIMLVVAFVLATTIQAGVLPATTPIPALPATALPMPSPEIDQDRDSYADAVDRTHGDLHVRLVIERMDVPRNALPYIQVGTQDDHWRLGVGAEQEWPHIVDVDALGHKAGSPGWRNDVIRTGAWWMSQPMEGASKALSEGSVHLDDVPSGVVWPQTFWVNVRDDRASVSLDIELHDSRPDPDGSLGAWVLNVDVPSGEIQIGDGATSPANATRTLTSAKATLVVRASLETGPSREEASQWANQWAPILRFDSQERFYPVRGEVLQQFHGFGRLDESVHDHRTWTREFNNARDPYILLLADFNGDRTTDHVDAALLYDVLATGPVGTPAVYASVHRATNDQVAITYWFLTIYNFVRDVNGDDIELLAHAGDREFISLLFDGPEAVTNGTPSSISYSQHYRGIRIPSPVPGAEPMVNGTHPDVYVAQGSHASYPVAGDDRRFRSALLGFGDVFDGEGVVWQPGDYTLELLESQEWHMGYLWGPITRHSRDLGTTRQPLLQHSFQYPFIDPLSWHLSLAVFEADELHDAYGDAP